MAAVLALDLGKSGSRAALWTADQDEPVGTADGPGTAGMAGPAGLAAAEAVIGQLSEQLLAAHHPGTVALCVGAAGAGAAGPAAAALAERLTALASVGHSRIGSAVVCSDAVIAQVGALGGRSGVVLVAGTGSVAFGIDGSGRAYQADGWGALLGDLGSGGWIGLAGLRAALADLDGRGPRTELSTAASALGGLAELPAMLAGHPNPAQLAAGFAPEVARLASAGDPAAQAILAEAAELLAAAVIAAAGRLAADNLTAAGNPAAGGSPAAGECAAADLAGSPVPVALVGGLLKLGPVLLAPLRRALAASPVSLAVQPALAGPLAGARLLATRQDTVAEALVHRAVPATPP